MTGERGSSSIVVAALVAILMILALGAADLARVLVAVSKAQSAADAAALAAAQELVLPSGRSPDDAAADYAGFNDAALVECRCDPGTLEATVTVRMIVTGLATLPGEREVEATARAVVDPGAG